MNTATGAAQATLRDVARLIALVASGLIAGAVLATGLADISLSGSAELYTAYRQATNGLFTATLPPLGGLALVAAAASAVLHQGRARTLSIAAAVCFVAALAVTVLVHFPVNAEILTWSPSAPPADWQQIQARWATAHLARTLLTLAGFVVLTLDRWRGRDVLPCDPARTCDRAPFGPTQGVKLIHYRQIGSPDGSECGSAVYSRGNTGRVRIELNCAPL